jgi:2-(1,2-epoxy-1,2-dihydrophenyl)acetyl-CoA isomerase
MPFEEFAGLHVEDQRSVRRITFHRPAKLNAFGPSELRDLRHVLQETAQDPRVRAVILTGSGRAFSAGGDVGAMADALEAGTLPIMFHDLVGEQERCVREIVEMPKPVVAALPGVAAGGGMSLALACDWRIGSPDAVLYPAFPALGGIPDGGLTYFLPHYLGLGGAQEVLFSNRRLDCESARALGLIHEIVPAAELSERAWARATELAQGPVHALGEMKRLLQAAFHGSLETQLALERRAMVQATRGPELPEGIRAFREKRPPRFASENRPREP